MVIYLDDIFFSTESICCKYHVCTYLGISSRYLTLHCRAKFHISGRRPGFDYPYWNLPEKLPEEADEEAVMLIGGRGNMLTMRKWC